MAIDSVVAKQYRDKVNQASKMLEGLTIPLEGWLRTIRNALGMSGVQLAKRLGVTKARIAKVEQDELGGGVTLKTMKRMAEAMNCRFVYAIIPDEDIEQVLEEQALKKSKARVKAASTHMALEAQSLDQHTLDSEIKRIASKIVREKPSDLWSDE